jgi:hypothetical protein
VQLASGGENTTSLLDVHGALVQTDGTFEVPNLPAGTAEIVGVCKGFAAVMRDDPFVFGGRLSPPEIDLQALGEPYVLKMEPTAALEVELRGPDGAPAAGVRVDAWPNACWSVGACGTYVEHRSWTAASGPDGRARIEDIPPGEHGFGVEHRELDLRREGENGDRFRRARFDAGETVRLSLDLVKKAGG